MIDGKYRRFTPLEAAKIQSFPESFNLDVVSENRQYRAIGNAVPPVLMWHVANALLKCCTIEKPKEVKEKRRTFKSRDV